jgi:RNA-directed DNA polymerase
MDLLESVPAWLLRPLPVGAVSDAKLHAKIDQLAENLPANLRKLEALLAGVQAYREYEAAANRAGAQVWLALDRILATSTPSLRLTLVAFAQAHLPSRAQARFLRRLARDPSPRIRDKVRRIVERRPLHEVALPQQPNGAWDTTGWFPRTNAGIGKGLARHRQGRKIQDKTGVPRLANLGQLRKLLDIRSPAQLGWFLLATDAEDGPYTKFTIGKNDGGEREICAPKAQLRWVQRRILDKILAPLHVHSAAHGFVPGRSTVTNAEPHRGAALLVKFDLSNFFPTIHYYRILGLFARLGYTVDDGRFGTDDASRRVAPVLARLCCYTPDPQAWGNAVMPQGAPTSPALSNLICRRLDARLTGLAQRNQGVYTRYADDLTFSFKNDDLSLGRFRWWVDQVCHQEGFLVHQKKFRVIRAGQRQLVTGIVVNDELRVPREERRRFRAMLHNCRQHGVASQARGNPRFGDYLRGFASYVHMIHPEEGTALLEQVDELLGTGAEGGDA